MTLPAIPAYSIDADVWRKVNRTSWSLQPSRAVLLVHDMQEHFVGVFERNGRGQICHAIERIAQLMAASRAAGVPVVFTAQPPAQDPAERALLTDFWGPGLQDDASARIIAELGPQPGDTELVKWRYSAFHRSGLRDQMRAQGRDQLIVTGVYAHIGCLTTALVAFMEDVQVFFVADAMADFSALDHEMAAEFVAGRCGQVTPAAEVLDRLRPRAVVLPEPAQECPA